jgi:hypothetical protein
MDASDWAALCVAVVTIVGSFVASVRWLVNHYLNELKENGGSSIKDTVTRLEEKVEILYEMMLHRDK